MKIDLVCPVVDKTVNERIARFNAFFTVLLIFAFVVTSNIWLIIFLAIDFYLRGANMVKFSPLANLSRLVLKYLDLQAIIINAGPKIFAARIGFIITVLTALFYISGFTNTAIFLALVLGIFSFLESVFAICVACIIYPYVYKFLYKKEK